jgi:hypothetical protein
MGDKTSILESHIPSRDQIDQLQSEEKACQLFQGMASK